MQKLQKIIGYTFKNPALLQESLTHPSLLHEKSTKVRQHNQRLEFLGDAVLQLVLTDRLYKLHQDLPEGKLTQLRAHLANRHSLYRRALAINLGTYLYLGKGEETSGGRTRLSNLADAYEALIGAIYLDGGIRSARGFLLRQFKSEFANLKHNPQKQNPKGQLQELLQTQSPSNPIYRVISESGPDHHKYFEIVVEWDGKEIGCGKGSSKKQAETTAAEDALNKLLASEKEAEF